MLTCASVLAELTFTARLLGYIRGLPTLIYRPHHAAGADLRGDVVDADSVPRTGAKGLKGMVFASRDRDYSCATA